MLHRNDNANLVRGSYCGQYGKRLPDGSQRAVFSHHLRFAEEHGRSMARHHLRRVGSAPSYTRSGEVEAVLGQYG
jgi:hypothetical protein